MAVTERKAKRREAASSRITLGEYMSRTPEPSGGRQRIRRAVQLQRTTAKWLARSGAGLPQGLQAVAIGDVGRRELEALTRIMSREVGPATTAKVLKAAMGLLWWARRDGLISRLPDASGLLPPQRLCARESAAWSQEEIREAIDCVRSLSCERGYWEGYPVLAALLLFARTGARKEEVFALRWRDLRLPGPQLPPHLFEDEPPRAGEPSILIRRQVKWRGRGWKLEKPKCEAARRLIRIEDEELIAALRHHWIASPRLALGLILANLASFKRPRPFGRKECPITRRIGILAERLGIRRDPETDAEREAGLGRPKGLHGLRHAYALQLLESGKDLSAVSKQLGHSSLAFTRRLYAWALQPSGAECPAEGTAAEGSGV